MEPNFCGPNPDFLGSIVNLDVWLPTKWALLPHQTQCFAFGSDNEITDNENVESDDDTITPESKRPRPKNIIKHVTISTRLMKVICSTLLAGKFAHMCIYPYR